MSATAPGGCNASACATVVATIGSPPATITWLGTTSADAGSCPGCGSWFNTTNWTSGCLPSCATDVVIPVVGTTIYPTIGFNGLGAAATKTLTINAAGGSTPSITFTDPKAELDICGDFTQNATVTTNNYGKIVFMGNVTQNFTRSGAATGDLYTVVLANTATPPVLNIKENSSGTNQDLNVTSSFTFQTGIVITEGAKKLYIKNMFAED